jgi:membrane fusion protein, multidrug efflux system
MRYAILFIFILNLAFSKELDIVGTVISTNQKMVGARYMGYVKNVYFDVGDKVKREDTLFEIESAEFDIMKNQADLGLEQARLMVEMYETRLDSIKREKKRLDSKGVVGIEYEDLQMTADNISATIASAQVLLQNATKKVKQVATIMDYLEVKAPNDGIIVDKRVQVGDLIVPGMLTMILVDLSSLEIEAEIAESDLFYIRTKQKVDISIPSLKYKTEGIIKSIVPNANPMAHTFKIRISFKNTIDIIFPGMYAKIKIRVDDIER